MLIKAAQPFLCLYPTVFPIHYIDDILVGHPDEDNLDKPCCDLQGMLYKQTVHSTRKSTKVETFAIFGNNNY